MPRSKQKARPRTYSRNRAVSRSGREMSFETDGVFLLKLVVCVLLGMFWLKFAAPLRLGPLAFGAVPLGALVGLLLVHVVEKHQSDRKIWYAVLVVVTIVSFFYPTGVTV